MRSILEVKRRGGSLLGGYQRIRCSPGKCGEGESRQVEAPAQRFRSENYLGYVGSPKSLFSLYCTKRQGGTRNIGLSQGHRCPPVLYEGPWHLF